MHLFYDPWITDQTQEYRLMETESHHICKVLHMKKGDMIGLINGKGLLVHALIVDLHDRKCQVEIISKTQQESPSHSIHIAIAPTKINDRIEYFVEKACEIGVTEISFIQTQNTIRKTVKVERFMNIAISALKQSQRLFLPKINEMIKFKQFITMYPRGYMAHCQPTEKQHLHAIFDGQSPILIGPEGDFSEDEILLALRQEYQLITLGETRLRTETAGVCACVMAQLKINELAS